MVISEPDSRFFLLYRKLLSCKVKKRSAGIKIRIRNAGICQIRKEVLGQSRQNPVMETICKVCPGSINPGDPLLLSLGRYLEENMTS